MHNLELTTEEVSLLRNLLKLEESDTHVEIHHARRTFEYRDALKARLKEIHALLLKFEGVLPKEEWETRDEPSSQQAGNLGL